MPLLSLNTWHQKNHQVCRQGANSRIAQQSILLCSFSDCCSTEMQVPGMQFGNTQEQYTDTTCMGVEAELQCARRRIITSLSAVFPIATSRAGKQSLWIDLSYHAFVGYKPECILAKP